jgi:hypothetical protein
MIAGTALCVSCAAEIEAPSGSDGFFGGGNGAGGDGSPNDGPGPIGSIGDVPGSPSDPSRPSVPGNPSDPNQPSVEPIPYACQPDAEPVPQTLRRLTETQYRAAVRDLAEAAIGGPLTRSDDDTLADALESLPPDVLSEDEDYPSLVQAVGQAHVDAYQAAAVAVAEVGADQAANRCSGDCRSLVGDIAEVAFRRPPLGAELDFLMGVMTNGDLTTDMGRVLQVLAQSPDFLYRLEEAGDVADQVDPYALANRLAFHFWNSPPDQELLEAAASGALMTDAGYQAQVDRLFASPRTRDAFHAFFEAWLELEEVPDMDANVDRADFAAYAGDDLPGPNLTHELVEDTIAFIDHVVWQENGSLADLFTRSVAVPPSREVAQLYGVDTVGEPVELDPSQRAGLLSRPAILAYNQAVTRPIMRGALVRVRLACADLQLPDMMADIQIPEPNVGETTREKVEALTENPATECAGCHALLNPFGFALESYDALGRYRTEEQAFDENGSLAASHPVDAASSTLVDGAVAVFDGPVQMGQVLSRSQDIERCFTQHYFRHTFGRAEDIARDGCTLESMRNAIHQGTPLADVFKSVAFTPEFKRLSEVNP